MASSLEISLDEKSYRALLDQSLTGIFILVEERIRWANRTVVDLLGFSAEELGEQEAWAFIHPEDRDRVRAIARERIAGVRESEVYETRMLRKDGTSIWAEIRATPIALEGRSAVLTNLVDITDRKQAEHALAESEERFRTFFENAPIGILAAGVAHDFNNLISAIEGSAWILLRKLAADSPLRRHADNIRATCDRASALTRRLFDFGRSRSEEPRTVSLNGVVDEMGQMLRGLLGSNIELRTRLALDLDPVLADQVQLEQVIVNLVINARDAMRPGGELTIETDNLHLTEPDPDWPGELEPGDYVLLRVTDTGEGMDGPTLERIFEPFFTSREDSGGMGMGLSTVKTIVTQAAGHIRVRSSPGQGTTVEILLPRTG